MGLFGKKKSAMEIFVLVGWQFDCKFKSKQITRRRDALTRTMRGDPVHVKQYNYKGENAYAVVSDRLGCDLGVIAKSDIPKLWKKFPEPEGTPGEVFSVIIEDDEYECTISLERR